MQKSSDAARNELIRLMEQSPEQRLPFRDFMAFCLYDERYGYYNQSQRKIGKEGDFYTSSSVGPFMGMMMGNAILRILRERGWEEDSWQIVEWGGGDGRLALNVLDQIRRQAPDAYERMRYIMIERSPYHGSLQRELLQDHRNVRYETAEVWFGQRPERPTFVCSNELLDAFPVHRVRYAEGRFETLAVRWDVGGQQFREVYLPLEEDQLLAYIRQLELPEREGQLFELNTDAWDWIRAVGRHLVEGAVLTIDYGDISDELYGPHRMRGTLMCYRKHQAHDDPYVSVGEQDITAHVNFTACIRAGEEAGLSRRSLETQREFLVGNGILEQLREHDGRDPFSAAAKSNRAIRQLLLSDQMSELFKVLIQFK